jgi:hypothetical protein
LAVIVCVHPSACPIDGKCNERSESTAIKKTGAAVAPVFAFAQNASSEIKQSDVGGSPLGLSSIA